MEKPDTSSAASPSRRYHDCWFHRALDLGATVRYFKPKPKFVGAKHVSPVDCVLLVFDNAEPYCTRMEGEDGRSGRRIAAINEGLSADDRRAINEGIERRLYGGFPGLGCVSPAEGTPQVGTEEGCG